MSKQKQESFKTAKANIWVAGTQEFTSKRAAYRHARFLNGNRAGGNSPYKVQRKNA